VTSGGATARGAVAATPLPRPEGGAAAKMVLVWRVCAWVTVVHVRRRGLQGLQFQGMVPFLAIARAIL
jgi:hypothetical protein